MERKKYILLVIASFILPGLIATAVLAALHVTPFGDKMLLFGDSYSYYAPWLSYFTSVLKGEHSMYYSFSDGIGANIALMDSTQLFHPVSIFFLLGGWDYMPQAFSAAIIFDTALCGFTMFICLSGILGKKETNIIFSTSYALMGYMVAYNYNPLFHMGVAFLPLMTLGLVKLIEEKRIALYVISIAYTVISGFQMGFIVCMASLFFFVAYIYIKNKELLGHRREIIIRYSVASVTGGLLGAVVWIPALLSCTDRISGTNLEEFTFVDNGPIMQMAAKLFSGADSTSQIINGYPVIFCGIFTVLLAILYFMNKEISKREKTAAAVVLVIYTLSFYIKAFKAVFQGFASNTWFNHRQSFVFSFVLLVMAAREISYIYEIDLNVLKKASIILLMSALIIFSSNYEFITGGNVVADLLILSLIMGGCVFYRIHPERSDKLSLVLIMLLCVSLQLYVNYYTSEKKILDEWAKVGVSEFNKEILERQPLISALQSSDTSMYRMEIENQMTRDMGQDPFLFHYNGVGHATYSSFTVAKMLQKLGINWHAQKANSYDSGVTAATDSLLGLKYIITKRDLEKEKKYEKLLNTADYAIYKNPNALDLLIVSQDGIRDVSIEDEKDIFKIQNNIWKAMTGEDKDVFVIEENFDVSVHNSTESIALESEEIDGFLNEMQRYIETEKEDDKLAKENDEPETDDNGINKFPGASYIEISFPAARDGAVYMYDSAAIVEDYGSSEDFLKYIGTYHKGELVTGRLYFDELVTRAFLAMTIDGLYVYYADNSVLEEYSEMLNNRSSSITRLSDTRLIGDVVIDDSQLMLFTIPYKKGWRLSINGDDIETFKSADLFLSAKVPKGEHSFELRYVVPGLFQGRIISVIGIMLFAIQLLAYMKNAKYEPTK